MGDRILEKVITVPFQCDPEAKPGNPLEITIADDGRLELTDREGKLWRCNVIKLFGELELAEERGVVYIQSEIKLNSHLALNPPGVPMEGLG